LAGNTLHIDFISCNNPREDVPSNRWGCKVKIKPIYGESLVFLTDSQFASSLNKLSSRLGGEQQLVQWLGVMNSYASLTSLFIGALLKGKAKTKEEENQAKYLEWNLFSSGLI